MKTFIATLILSFASVAMFTGCSSEQQSDTDVPDAPAAPETPETPDEPEAP